MPFKKRVMRQKHESAPVSNQLAAIMRMWRSIPEKKRRELFFRLALCTIYRSCWMTVQCVRKKRDQNVFGNISDKTRAILMKFDTRFPE